MRRIILALTLAASTAQGGQWFSNGGDGATGALERAHAAYLAQDMVTLANALREVMSDPDADLAVRQNAFALLAKAYEVNGGNIPVDWHLPEGVREFKVNHVRKEDAEGVVYKLSLSVSVPEKDTLTQLQLVHFPDQVVLDKSAGVGTWEVEADEGQFKIDFQTRTQAAPLADGLYMLQFGFKDGRRASGWFLLSDLTSTATPRIAAPAFGESVATGNPEIVWDDFHSPEYKPYERRTLNVSVGQLFNGGEEWQNRWYLYRQDPVQTRTVVGRDPAGSQQIELSKGDYWLVVSFMEQRRFGDLKMRRVSRTARGFHVDR